MSAKATQNIWKIQCWIVYMFVFNNCCEMSSIQAIRKTVFEPSAHKKESEGFKTVLELFINNEEQGDHEERLFIVNEDITVELLYFDDNIKRTTTLLCKLYDYWARLRFQNVKYLDKNKQTWGIANYFFRFCWKMCLKNSTIRIVKNILRWECQILSHIRKLSILTVITQGNRMMSVKVLTT